MATRKITYTSSEISSLPNNKPVLYRIKTKSGKENYVGIAQKGRVQERLLEHRGVIPGVSITIETFSSIKDARKKESLVIKREQPKYNKQGK